MINSNLKKNIYIDMDDTLCDFKSAYLKSMDMHPKIKFPQSTPGFFTNLDPLPGALNCFNWLNNQPEFDVYILTAPSIKNPLCYTEKRLWIEAHLGLTVVNQLIISPHKQLLKGDFLIDDNLTGKGQDKFEGAIIHFGSDQFPNWSTVKNFFETLLTKIESSS